MTDWQERLRLPISPRRRARMQRDGGSPASPLLTGSLLTLVAAGFLWCRGTDGFLDTAESFQQEFRSVIIQQQLFDLESSLGAVSGPIILFAAELMFTTFAAVLLILVLQVGLHVLPLRVLPHWNRLDPSRYLETTFQGMTARRLGFSLALLASFFSVVVGMLIDHSESLAAVGGALPSDLMMIGSRLIFRLLVTLSLMGLLAGIWDYSRRRFRYDAMQRVTPDEARTERHRRQ